MFRSYINKSRLASLVEDESFKDYVPFFRHPEYRDMYLVMKNGELVFFHKNSLYPVPACTLDIPKKDRFNWILRDQRTHSSWHNHAVALVSHMEMRNVSDHCGIHFITWPKNDVKYYLKRDSIKGDWIVLYTRGGQAVSIPSVMLREFQYGWFNDVHPYTAKIEDLCCEGDSSYRPIIEITNERLDPIGAYTRLVEVPNCPGVYDYLSYDVIININTLDNSGIPVVDLAPFMTAIHNNYDHDCKEWSLNIDEIKLRVGMMPEPIAIGKLDVDLPGHRFFLKESNSPGFGTGLYTYTNKLPTKFP